MTELEGSDVQKNRVHPSALWYDNLCTLDFYHLHGLSGTAGCFQQLSIGTGVAKPLVMLYIMFGPLTDAIQLAT